MAKATAMAGHQVSIMVTRRVVRRVDTGAGVVEAPQSVGGCGRVGLDKPAQQLLAAPGGADLVGGVITGPEFVIAMELAAQETITGGEQHPGVHPHRVDGGLTGPVPLSRDTLGTSGTISLASPHQMVV